MVVKCLMCVDNEYLWFGKKRNCKLQLQIKKLSYIIVFFKIPHEWGY
jgi:hypothetical protein